MKDIYDNYGKKPKVKVIKGDFIDRLHGRISVQFLFIILILILFKQAIYSNILCWYPTALSGPQGEYLSQFCWINSTYLFPDEYDSENYAAYHHEQASIPYYQYIVFIIIGQILLFYLPSMIWQIMSSNSNGYINKLLDISSASFKNTDISKEFIKVFKTLRKTKIRGTNEENNSLKNIKEESIDEESNEKYTTIEKIGIEQRGSNQQFESMDSNDSSDRKHKMKLISELNPLGGMKFLALKYLLLKVLNLSNSVCQFLILNRIFGYQFLDYGFKYALKLWNSQNPLLMTKEFPIYTLCDFYVHQPNRKIHENTVQCILTMNVLLEKFYVLIWLWLIFLSVVTLWNLLSWMYEIMFSAKAKFLYKYINIYSKMSSNKSARFNDSDEANTNEKNKLLSEEIFASIEIDDIQNFQRSYLKTDGLVMILIIKSVAGDVAFIKLLGVLYNDFQSEFKKIQTKIV